jgi:hypothetical protein
MGKKIFVSYKYGDSLVYNLPNNYFTTVRHYVDELQNLIDEDDHINKGENDGEDLSSFKDSTIASKLRGKIFDSSITIVIISKGMKEVYTAEKDQWIPWEISYSLKELSRDGRTSKTNAVLAVVLPDENNSYSYFLTYDSECNCTNHNTPFLFELLRKNMFNLKKPDTSLCNGQTVHKGEYSYIKCVKWDEFIKNINGYIATSDGIKDKKDDYEITKQIN